MRFPVFRTTLDKMRPIFAIKHIVGDIGIHFLADGISVRGTNMEGYIAFDLHVEGQVTLGEADAPHFVGVEPELLETSMKNIKKTEEILLSIGTNYDEERECVYYFVTVDIPLRGLCHIDILPLEVSPILLPSGVFEKADKYANFRIFNQNVIHLKKSKSRFVQIKGHTGDTHLAFFTKGTGLAIHNSLPLYADAGMEKEAVLVESNLMDSYFSMNVLSGINTIVLASSSITASEDYAFRFEILAPSVFVFCFPFEGGYFHCLMSPIPANFVQSVLGSKRGANRISTPKSKGDLRAEDREENEQKQKEKKQKITEKPEN